MSFLIANTEAGTKELLIQRPFELKLKKLAYRDHIFNPWGFLAKDKVSDFHLFKLKRRDPHKSSLFMTDKNTLYMGIERSRSHIKHILTVHTQS